MPAAPEPTGVRLMWGVLLKDWAKVMVAMQPGEVPPPVLKVMEPAVSDPLTELVPPLPKLPLERLGILPPATKWRVILRSPLICSFAAVSWGVVTGPLKEPLPLTLRFCCTVSCP